MTVILISGKSGSGKDTLAAAMKEILINEHKRPLIIHFASQNCFKKRKTSSEQSLRKIFAKIWIIFSLM